MCNHIIALAAALPDFADSAGDGMNSIPIMSDGTEIPTQSVSLEPQLYQKLSTKWPGYAASRHLPEWVSPTKLLTH